MASREHFGSRAAVIMAMAGSAIGLGNIWRFPFIAGQYGGAAFILVYIFFCLLVSLPILLCESVIGRRTHKNTVGAMKELAPGSGWKFLGLLTVIAPVILLSYYSVVGGWSVEYLYKAVTLQFRPEAASEVPGMFGSFVSSSGRPVLCLFVFLAITAVIVYLGVKKGIERFSKVSMPVLFVLVLVIAVYSMTLAGSNEGVQYLVRPDFSKLTPDALAAALGQSFFSLSLGAGTMLTYSSYVSKDEDLVASGAGTAVSDLLFAVLAGFAVMPAVFASGIAPTAGPGLVFETLPFIFAKMGSAAGFMSAAASIVFFLTILVAALTSSISMMEVGVAYLVEERHVSRHRATLGIFFFSFAAGILCSLSFGPLSGVKIAGNSIFDFLDKLCSNWLLTLGALFFCLFVGWKMDRSAVRDELTNGGSRTFNARVFPVIYFLVRYIAPAAILLVFLSGVVG